MLSKICYFIFEETLGWIASDALHIDLFKLCVLWIYWIELPSFIVEQFDLGDAVAAQIEINKFGGDSFGATVRDAVNNGVVI